MPDAICFCEMLLFTQILEEYHANKLKGFSPAGAVCAFSVSRLLSEQQFW